MSIVDDFLCAGEDASRGFGCRSRRDRLLLAEEIGLVVDRLNGSAGRKPGLDRRGLFGNDRRSPVFVGEPEPAAIALEGDRFTRILFDPRVGDFLHSAVADHADEAFMQHRIAGDVRLAVAQNERERLYGRRRASGVHDRIGDREHILVVDRDDALEGEVRAIVPGQRHRLIGGQGFAVGGPDGIEIGSLAPPALTKPVSAQ